MYNDVWPIGANEKKDYSLSFGAEVGTGEALTGVEIYADPPSITVDISSVSGGTVLIWASGATAGQFYTLTLQGTVSNQRVIESKWGLACADKRGPSAELVASWP